MYGMYTTYTHSTTHFSVCPYTRIFFGNPSSPAMYRDDCRNHRATPQFESQNLISKHSRNIFFHRKELELQYDENFVETIVCIKIPVVIHTTSASNAIQVLIRQEQYKKDNQSFKNSKPAIISEPTTTIHLSCSVAVAKTTTRENLYPR